MGNPFEDLRQAVVVRPMNSPGPQGAEAPEMKIQYSNDGSSWHNDPVDTDRYLRFSTDNGMSWSSAIYFNNLAETLEWVEKAKQWATNPENDPVEDLQYSALHHALQAKKSEITAGEYAVEAGKLITGAYGIAPPSWDSATVYNYGDIVSFDNGQVYRCIGTNIVGANHAPNINGIDNEEDWIRVTAILDGYFEVDKNGDFMPMMAPVNSDIFMLDENGDIMYQDPIDIEASMTTIELFTLDENGDIAYRDPTDHRPGGGNIELYKKIEFVDSIADFRNTSFYGTTEYVYVAGYYGAGTPGGGMFYRDPGSIEDDNGGTIIVDGDGVRWKRANVHEEYYASWFGVSTHLDDNSPFIQNALNTMPSRSVLIFGPGTYECKQTITMPDDTSTLVKGISLHGSVNMISGYYQAATTRLKYTGPNPSILTPFIDFRGSTRNKKYTGSIRGMIFTGIDQYCNLVGLWFYQCTESTFENILISNFKYGIQINYYYYCSVFNNIRCMYCDCGLKTYISGNFSSFNYCHFSNNNIGCAFNLSYNSICTGVSLNSCYFENDNIAIQTSQQRILNIHQCYFEHIHECIIDIIGTYLNLPQIISLQGVRMDVDFSDLASNRAAIRQSIHPGSTLSLSLKNNVITNYGNTIPDYFVYVESGDIIIQAENNKMVNPSWNFPICSKTPLKTSYFNNDFSDTN